MTADGAAILGEDSLESRLDRLDEIAEAMEADDVSLDDSLKLFEEAVDHLRAVDKALGEAKMRVDELIGRSGSSELRPLDTERQ